MSITISNINALVALVFGALVLIYPRLLEKLVGIYLVIVGLLGLGIINF